MAIAYVSLSILSLALIYAVFDKAGVTADWNFSVAVVGFVSGMYFLICRKRSASRLDRLTVCLLCAFVAIPVLQVAPLPVGVVAVVSPARLELLRATEALFGQTAAWVTLSVAPWLTLQYAITAGGLVLVFAMVRELSLRCRQHEHPWVPVWPLLAVAAAEGAVGLFQAYAEGGEGFARGTYVNRDHYAGLLELVLPFAVLYAVAILSRNNQRRESQVGPSLIACGILAVAAVLLLGIVLSLCRMAFLATMAALFVSGSIAVTLRSYMNQPVKMSGWLKYLPVGSVATVVLLGFVFLPTDPLMARFSELARTDDISADTRAQIWRDTVGLVRAFPVIGSGLGTYESAFLRYKTVAPMNTVDYAHNDYLQILAEMGIVGFAIGLILALRVMYSAVSGAVFASQPDDRLLSVACIGSLTAILLHSFVDFNLYVPANAFAIAWVAGLSSTRLRVRTPVSRKKKLASVPSEMSEMHPVS